MYRETCHEWMEGGVEEGTGKGEVESGGQDFWVWRSSCRACETVKRLYGHGYSK